MPTLKKAKVNNWSKVRNNPILRVLKRDKYKIQYVFPVLSIACNKSKVNPRYMRILQFSLILMNASLFLNAFIYLYHSEGLSGETLYLIGFPWLLTCAVSYIIGLMFQQSKKMIKLDMVTNFKKSLSFAITTYVVLVAINLGVQFFLISHGSRTADALNKTGTLITFSQWLGYYGAILLLDTAADGALCLLLYVL